MNTEMEVQPPDDFRQISVYPNVRELTAAGPGFLRENVVKGQYKDVNHYLDVHFRLLREDFVGPLRADIGMYRSGVRKRLESVRIYEGVRFLNTESVSEKFCIRVRFDASRKGNFRDKNSKRFMFGSLLCFTVDKFATIMFGKVAEQKQKGELIVSFDQNFTLQYNVDYVMVECGVFLNVLQDMSVKNFPMEKYLLRVDPTAQPPEYLTRNTIYNIEGHRFLPLMNWPQRNFYGLNDSQLAAFTAGLTQEFSIIQGPPGTGKTFLGLRIAETLLKNYKVWYEQTPILVICQANHALDQFLEGLTHLTERVIRVGGQSKNKKLENFNIRNKGRSKMSRSFYLQRNEVRIILAQIRSITRNLEQIELYKSVTAFDGFEEVVPNFRKTWFARASMKDILDWLLAHKERSTTANINVVDLDVMQISEAIANIQLEDIDGDEEDLNGSDYEDEFIEIEAQVDDIFEEVEIVAVPRSNLITTHFLERQIQNLQHKLDELQQIETPTREQLLAESQFSLELLEVSCRYSCLNVRLAEGKKKSGMKREMPALSDLNNPHKMPPKDRWNLYFYWLELYKQKLKEKSNLLNKQFRVAFKNYTEIRDIDNIDLMKRDLVVGMTTTCAARLRTSLQALKSPIVIVEEAAVVLEAHIVSALTRHCKHLILIGDHQQLKPSTADYQIEKKYKLGISLFERMVVNKIQLHTLNVQHRMRPEISSLIAPTIYPNLKDHASVNERPAIKGVANCLFFIDHNHEEMNCEGKSKKNLHEVEFLIHFAKHLILNGYKPKNVTILVAYKGQMLEMEKERAKHDSTLRDVRISVLDGYQGEECDIILLSLVRSNTENKIGFLSIENRVCVALSRARNGLYVMGNMTQLCDASELWPKIRRSFEQQNAIGSELALRCQVHRDRITYVKNGDDFLGIPEGGCNQKCGFDLSCGHKCTSLCHLQDRDHELYRCRETCNKPLCQKMCCEECGPCVKKCPLQLPCGHPCMKERNEPCTVLCLVDANPFTRMKCRAKNSASLRPQLSPRRIRQHQLSSRRIRQ